jgi:hypothetical protein
MTNTRKILHTLSVNWEYLLIGPLLLTASLTAFLNYHNFAFLSFLAITSYVVFILCGLVLGIAMALGGILVQTVLSSSMIVLIFLGAVDRSEPFLDGAVRYSEVGLVAILTLVIFFYFIRIHLAQFLLITFGTLWVVLFFTPNEAPVRVVVDNSYLKPKKNLPPYIHIILDEHIGIEGIPPFVDKNFLAEELKNKYIKEGFRVFGRAYSRYSTTLDSFSSFLNIQPLDHPYQNRESIKKITTIKPNALFDFLSKQGYIINILEHDLLSLCDTTLDYRIGKCVRYSAKNSMLIEDSISLISHWLYKIGLFPLYHGIATLADWPKLHQADLSPSSTLAGLGKFYDSLGESNSGNAYFIHLLIPHSAYILDEKCFRKTTGWHFFRPDQSERLSTFTSYDHEQILSKEIDALSIKYKPYLKQIKCSHVLVDKIIKKLKLNQKSKNSTIVIHSDHGSRLTRIKPIFRNILKKIDFSEQSFIQNFSSFFVIRGPGLTPGYSRDPLSLDELIATLVMGRETDSSNIKKEKFVYFSDSSYKKYKRVTLPPFANGIAAQAW